MPKEPVLTGGEPTNLYLPKELKKAAKKAAATHYSRSMSLSELVQRLLVAELKRKRGIAHLNERELVMAGGQS
jgi:organic radical activating enzyme